MKNEVYNAYQKLIRNNYFISEMRPYLIAEVRELAVNKSMKKLNLWDKFCQVDSNVKQSLSEAIKKGYGKDVLKYHLAHDQEYCEAEEIINLIDTFINSKKSIIKGNNHSLTIPTKAKPEEILSFWLKLQGNNEKGQPYWGSKAEIEHFVYQNFEGFPGVAEIKEFTPNMNKSELYQVVWAFSKRYGIYRSKKQYEDLLLKNFTQFRNAKNVYSNIKYYGNKQLRQLYK